MTDTGGASEDGLTVLLNCGHRSEAPHLDRTGVTVSCEGRGGEERVGRGGEGRVGRGGEKRRKRRERSDEEDGGKVSGKC